MTVISHADAYQVLLLQAADDGRGPVLFGESFARAREVAQPFMVGETFPSVYLEHPLLGDPFLDVTVLFGKLEPGTSIDSPLAPDCEEMLEWHARAISEADNICCGFELDTKDPSLPVAAVHCQPRAHIELVEPFCEAVGEPERAAIYLSMSERMPKEWPLSFFGMFRGRPGSPLRVCGYLSNEEVGACAVPTHLAERFREIGFSAYDDAMLEQVASLMAAAPGTVDFQLDVMSDGTLGPTFAIDVQFEIAQPEAVCAAFTDGPAARVMEFLENCGVADERWHLVSEASFARSIFAEDANGKVGRYSFTLMPQWVKARWTNGVMQPAKHYFLAKAGMLETKA